MSKKIQKTPEQELKCIAHNTKMVLGIMRRKSGHVQLSTAQAKALWRSLHTVSLYLEQPESIRKVQVQKIFEVRNALELEYKEQTGKEIDK